LGEEDRGIGLASEGRRTRQALEQQTAKRVDVGSPLDGLAADLLRSDVIDCPDQVPLVA
jgi:hypothetical protein